MCFDHSQSVCVSSLVLFVVDFVCVFLFVVAVLWSRYVVILYVFVVFVSDCVLLLHSVFFLCVWFFVLIVFAYVLLYLFLFCGLSFLLAVLVVLVTCL